MKAMAHTELRGGIDLDDTERFQLLASDRRRLALDVLETRSAPLDLASLADAIATREADGEDADASQVRSVSIDLHHTHLPKLAELDLIEYAADSNRIEAVHL